MFEALPHVLSRNVLLRVLSCRGWIPALPPGSLDVFVDDTTPVLKHLLRYYRNFLGASSQLLIHQDHEATECSPENKSQMRTGKLVMLEGPVTAVQQQPNREIYPQAVGVSLDGLQGQVPFPTQSSSSHRRTMSEPVPLLNSAPDPGAGQDRRRREMKMENRSTCDPTNPDSKQNGHSSEQQEGSPSVSPSEDCSSDGLRIVKHQPSVIVFCDHGCDHRGTVSNGSSDGGESSSPSTEEGEGDNDEDDDFSETLQYKEFLASRRRTNSSRNRKSLRKREDAQLGGSASGRPKPTDQDSAKSTGMGEEEENNGKQSLVPPESLHTPWSPLAPALSLTVRPLGLWDWQRSPETKRFVHFLEARRTSVSVRADDQWVDRKREGKPGFRLLLVTP
ncbi:unnamed protein product [Pleuronectes platessa]|uniref:Uncharacterized protein n=1 Tax=Pleuronectes platessa TaxID=8262 RepID=A0A9N7VWA1_PLEPL|nr:unnamed protein product [Pleuronectes platessa]